MAWEKLRNSITKEKPSSFYHISDSEYMERWLHAVDNDWITKTSTITNYGYAVYVLTCLCLDKTSMFGGPLIKSKMASMAINLEYYGIIHMNVFKLKYQLGNNGPGILTVLVKCIRGHGSPRI